MIESATRNGTAVSHSEFTFVASICQGKADLAEHSDVEPESITDPDYRTAYETAVLMLLSGETLDRDLMLAYVEAAGMSVDAYKVRRLFDDDVTGNALEFHKQKMREAWADTKILKVQTQIERALKERDFGEVARLTEKADCLQAGLHGPQRNAWTVQKLGNIFEPPSENEPIVEGLIRRAEVGQITSVPKAKKSWMMLQKALAVCSGQDWLGRKTTRGKVLLLDNELRWNTIANRASRVARRMSVSQSDIDERFEFIALRGTDFRFGEIESQLERILTTDHVLLIADAKYRFYGELEENSNTDNTIFHNAVDRWSQRFNIAVQLVHHSSKGTQSDKAITDVGAGGGAQSRATDCYTVLREHEQDGLFVMESELRTFAKPEPVTLRFDFPLWEVDHETEPELKKSPTRNEQRQQQAAKDKATAILQLLRKEPSGVLSESRLSGGHPERPSFRAAVTGLESDGLIEWDEEYRPPRTPKDAEPIGGWKLLSEVKQ